MSKRTNMCYNCMCDPNGKHIYCKEGHELSNGERPFTIKEVNKNRIKGKRMLLLPMCVECADYYDEKKA